MSIDRREFLKRAGMLGGAAAALAAFPGCRQVFPSGFDPGPGLLDMSATHAPVDHIVVVMMENRSFDHALGWLADDAAYIAAGKSRYGEHFAVDGRVHQTFPGVNGPVATQHLLEAANETNPFQGCGHPDPGHGWLAARAERDGGFLAPGSGNDEFALGYYKGADLPFTANLARRFTVCDNSHASLLGPTFPNRFYLHSGQSNGRKDNALPTAPFEWATIWDRLAAAGVPAAYYASDLPFLALWGNRLVPSTRAIADYFTDCAAGTLPNVTFIDPAFVGAGENDDHPLADVRAGQHFLKDVFKAFTTSRHWQSGAFILTYDEWGGFFDHVAPPHFTDDRASSNDFEDFGQAGFRVPTIVASPFSPKGLVDDSLYDHSSILRFLEWRFLGAPAEGPGGSAGWSLTSRDRNAFNIGASLRSTRVSNDLGFDLDTLPIGTPDPPCGSVATQLRGGVNARTAEDNDFLALLESGLIERNGFKVYEHA